MDKNEFVKQNCNHLQVLMNFLNSYSKASGQLINADESSFLVHHSSQQCRRDIIASVTNFREGNFPFTYLGAPISYRKIKSSQFDFLIHKISKKTAGWKGRLLSSGGKLTLIKSVLSSIPIHTLAVLKPSEGVLKSIEKSFAIFFWGETGGKSKKSWISWSKISKPISEGGLGIKSLSDVMKSLHAKMAWTVISSNSLFSLFMRAKYRNNIDIMSSCQAKPNHSPTWKLLCSVWNFVSSNTSFLDYSSTPIWNLSSHGEFSTKSAWNGIRNSSSDWSIATHIWKSYIPCKISVFVWKLWNRGIPTNNRISQCSIPLVSKCSCCSTPSCESEDHLFKQSEMASTVWKYFADVFGISNLNGLHWKDSCLKWWVASYGKTQDKILASLTQPYPLFNPMGTMVIQKL